MNVGELKRILETYTDETPVVLAWGSDGGVRSPGEAEEFEVEFSEGTVVLEAP